MNDFWKTKDEFPGSISLPYGIKTSHTWHEVGQILRMINDLDVDMFMELGTHVGGLASILIPLEKIRNFFYTGIEKDMSIVHDAVKNHIHQMDLFDVNTLVHVGNVIRGMRKAFLYCDNGDKVREMRAYLKLLRPGDIIACHDYYDGQEVYGLKDFGTNDSCGCKPEVWREDIAFLLENSEYSPLPDYLLEGTRIMGFIRK